MTVHVFCKLTRYCNSQYNIADDNVRKGCDDGAACSPFRKCVCLVTFPDLALASR